MKIEYSEKIDKEIIREVNKMCPSLSKVMGFNFDKKVKFDKRFIQVAKAVAKASEDFFDEKKMRGVMDKIYKTKMPEVKVFINTSGFATWNIKKKYISVPMNFMGESFFNHACHEANHFMYDFAFGTKKYEDTEIKEIITVINNAFGIHDSGWPKFREKREKVLDVYNKTKDIGSVIDSLK
ncbi:MAG: hypothetical protein A2365_00770 [Candidatus Nealsonbacteria bacterium RIFOXYB1_FULL_40_15]|uniref:Uncharacterized protein n=1 Tax=Candidatus Nealsonbacteria bacterium RIFOXYB1_FULL_40_15 TaxID=1801677 RepID=A0A1G2EN66_9BACT|nr:MAG: hypothetical protein A2365_00770 [Candidatus Nealsonbacteria bacterium RIFOXYB1_FULL_40_15]OGZ28519.1 MAG: hypothetical protein A2562_03460 [Candidatus Nealsonbacteria bacterium RIFOXYD1_FULL_39_11]